METETASKELAWLPNELNELQRRQSRNQLRSQLREECLDHPSLLARVLDHCQNDENKWAPLIEVPTAKLYLERGALLYPSDQGRFPREGRFSAIDDEYIMVII